MVLLSFRVTPAPRLSRMIIHAKRWMFLIQANGQEPISGRPYDTIVLPKGLECVDPSS
jgi:hypothetical protein